MAHDAVLTAIGAHEDIWVPNDLGSWTMNRRVIYRGMMSGFTREQLNHLSLSMPEFAEAVRKAMQNASEAYVTARRKAYHTSAAGTETDFEFFESRGRLAKETIRQLRRSRKAWAKKTFLGKADCSCSCSCSRRGSGSGSSESSEAAKSL